jgi:hypothetical protein
MKVALCLSGQPRSFEKGYEYHYKNLLKHHDVDVFYHTWNESELLLDKVRDVWKPVKTLYTNVFDDRSFDKYDRTTDVRFPSKNTVHMLYSVFKSILLKKEYELEKGFVYDCVIKSRFDYALNITLPLSKIEDGKLYVPGDLIKGQIPPNGIACNDQFAFGHSDVMDLYGMTFLNIHRAYLMNFPVSGEDMLSANLQINGLIKDKLVYIDMNNTFLPGKYNSTPHCLIRDDFSDWNKLRG